MGEGSLSEIGQKLNSMREGSGAVEAATAPARTVGTGDNRRGPGSSFGGVMSSGRAREGGVWGIEGFLDAKTISGWLPEISEPRSRSRHSL